MQTELKKKNTFFHVQIYKRPESIPPIHMFFLSKNKKKYTTDQKVYQNDKFINEADVPSNNS